MTPDIVWQIPPSVLRHLAELPQDRPVVLLLRHSVRYDLPPDTPGNDVPLTEIGRALARDLGAVIGPRLRSLHSSPIPRCVDTALALRDGAGLSGEVTENRLLGDPGAFVLDGATAWGNWQRLGHEGVMARLASGPDVLPGMADADAAARFLVHCELAQAGQDAGVHVFVSHDSVIAATASRLLGQSHGPAEWPWYLEGAFFLRADDGSIRCLYRDWDKCVPGPLCRIDERDVKEFARREIALTIGLDCPARFFLAGGAFKTLLTGRPPRDLDVWAPTPEDSRLLVDTLVAKGARRLPGHQFAEAFEIAGRVVEVPVKAEPSSLDQRLARFDIALSAIGVEFRPAGGCRARIDPLASISVETRQVRLLAPETPKRFAAITLERMYRYASELGYAVSVEDEIMFRHANRM